jgi:hypothetical protein
LCNVTGGGYYLELQDLDLTAGCSSYLLLCKFCSLYLVSLSLSPTSNYS